MGFTCAPVVTSRAVVSYTALPPLPVHSHKSLSGGTFLLHWPWSRLHRTLSGTLPCEARTFLTCCLSAITAAITCLTCKYLLYHIFSKKKELFLPHCICRRSCEFIASLILRMSIMSFHPDKCHIVWLFRFQKPFPEIHIFLQAHSFHVSSLSSATRRSSSD